MTEPCACTIVSNNYLAFARVLAESLLARHPEMQIFVLVVDEPASGIDYSGERFRVIFADELDIPRFRHFAFKYSLLELNTAVKPYFLKHLHASFGVTEVLYFDPDIKVKGDLTPLFESLDQHNILLTPHLLEPLEDEFRPSERSILLSGVYNLGFLGLRFNDQTLEFLEWWQKRLYSYCLHRISDGLFVDQRWMDLAPCLLSDVDVVRDPGCNVAYWNLANRYLVPGEQGWQVNGNPLRFFHFSGLVVDDLEQISKYQDRYKLKDRAELRPLFKEYRQDLLTAGWESTRSIPYAYGRFHNGIGVPDLARTELWRVDATGDRWPDPFAVEGSDTYYSWLNAGVQAETGPAWLPRMALVLWEHRPDLQGAFPDPLATDHPHYVRWLVSDEPRAAGIDADFFRKLETVDLPRTGTGGKSADSDDSQGHHLLSMDTRSDADAGPRLPRLAMLIWEKRPDLQDVFQAPLGQSRAGFARWFVTFARVEYQLPRALWLPTLQSLPLMERARAHAWWWLHRSPGKAIETRGSWRDFGPQA